MILRLLAYTLLFSIIAIANYKLSYNYSYSSLKDYLSALLSISSMVFTLMGIWIAFLYPNALVRISNPKKIEHVDFSESLEETKRLEGLVGSVIKSALVVLAIMIIFFLKALYPIFSLDQDTILVSKSLLISLISILSLLQVESILYVIYSNVLFINDLHHRREEREADEDI
ncbi:hypothetical protein [Pleionea sp. CnH1-48]|uniref:hypothetical protein n=1 Tax=Pleionea sp. CnH1-48 TaxID=2954494 RepID=UPI0020985A78|nr:hypothetical protein [Pleionea sp. CnH1-48]MCO7223148.1 hypothetical protein [Pleionea sp. CnH1-48]